MTLALLTLASLAVSLASHGSHYKRKPEYDGAHPATWILYVLGIASIAVAVWTVVT